MSPYYCPPSLRVLWVDDQPENNQAFAADIERRGVHVSYALSTSLALTLLKKNKYLAVISDVGRREGPREGFHLLDSMRSHGDQTPFCFFASLNAQALREEALLHDAQESTNSYVALLAFIDSVVAEHVAGSASSSTA